MSKNTEFTKCTLIFVLEISSKCHIRLAIHGCCQIHIPIMSAAWNFDLVKCVFSIIKCTRRTKSFPVRNLYKEINTNFPSACKYFPNSPRGLKDLGSKINPEVDPSLVLWLVAWRALRVWVCQGEKFISEFKKWTASVGSKMTTEEKVQSKMNISFLRNVVLHHLLTSGSLCHEWVPSEWVQTADKNTNPHESGPSITQSCEVKSFK